MHVTKYAVKHLPRLVAQVLDARVAVTMPAAPLQHEVAETPETKPTPTGLSCPLRCFERQLCQTAVFAFSFGCFYRQTAVVEAKQHPQAYPVPEVALSVKSV